MTRATTRPVTGTAASLRDLENRLGHVFSKPDLLRRAVTHASAESKAWNAYERLEFLGDRVLDLVVAEHLLDRFPEEREGEIARRHVQLVRREALASVARAFDFGQYLIISHGEEDAGARDSDSILSDSLEAVIAALYLDGGLEVARAFILRDWNTLVAADEEPPVDAKTALQEWAQGRQFPLPAYEVVAQEGLAHAPEFTICVTVADYPPRTAKGSSKRRAEQAAAALLLVDLEGV